MAGPPPKRGTRFARPVSAIELLRRVRARGGDLRVNGRVVQYRPTDVLTSVELDWLCEHRGEIVRALTAPDPDDADAFRRWLEPHLDRSYAYAGNAGPGVPAWVPAPRVLRITQARSRAMTDPDQPGIIDPARLRGELLA